MPAFWRKSDPETSREAALSQTEEKLTKVQEAVLSILNHVGPAHDQKLIGWYKGASNIDPDLYPPAEDSSIRSRRAELVARGKVAFTGEYHVMASGRRARIWAAIG
jgi:hypothetical protein